MRFIFILGTLLAVFFQPVKAEITKSIDPQSKLIGWQLIDGNLNLKIKQRTPNQTRAFLDARGFSKSISNKVANSCVFQAIIRNTAHETNQTIHVSLKSWRLKINGKNQPIKLKETWFSEWENQSVSQRSHLAFRWGTFPTEQSFSANGDYNWGMISFGPKPGSQFDLYIEWKNNTQTKNAWIKNITCAINR